MVNKTAKSFAAIWLIVALISNVWAFQKSSPGEEEIRKMLKAQSGKFSYDRPTNDQEQDAEAPKPNPWAKSWMLNISGNQASYSNWSQGGVNSLATSATTNLRLKYNGEEFANSIRVNLQYGQTWLDGEGSKKTADLINVRNKVDYYLTSEDYSTFAEVDFRTQFVKGYDDKNQEVVSNFMAPGYLTESIGFSYQPEDYFSAQLGMGLKQTFVQIDTLGQYYGLDADENMRSEGGVTVAVKVDKDFAKTFNYSGELTTFTNLLAPIRSTDMIFRNELSGKLSSFLSTVIQFELMFDDDVTKKIQMRQAISVGFVIKLL